MREFASGIETLPIGASVPSDSVMAVTIELDALKDELKGTDGDSPDFDEPDIFIPAPLKPRPHLDSGALDFESQRTNSSRRCN